MALIVCSECGKEFSDKALKCPNCGCPTEKLKQILEQEKTNDVNKVANNDTDDNVPFIKAGVQMETSVYAVKNYTQRVMMIILIGLFCGMVSKILSVLLVGIGIYYLVKTEKNGFKIPIGSGILIIILLFFSICVWMLPKESNSTEDGKESSSQDETLVSEEHQKKIEYGSIEDFSYNLSQNKIILQSYKGESKILEIKSTYEIDGKKYKTDMSNFQVGIGDNSVTTLIIGKGIKTIDNAIFNSCNIENVFFPKSMKKVYDNTLAYLSTNDEKTIKIYYAGTKKQWKKIFKKYKAKNVTDTEFGEEMGNALADKLNKAIGHEYDSSRFEYFYSASPNDLKK